MENDKSQVSELWNSWTDCHKIWQVYYVGDTTRHAKIQFDHPCSGGVPANLEYVTFCIAVVYSTILYIDITLY